MDASTAQTHLDAWLAAELAVTSGQAYQIGEVTVTRANLKYIGERISYWQRIVDSYASRTSGGTSRAALASFSGGF